MIGIVFGPVFGFEGQGGVFVEEDASEHGMGGIEGERSFGVVCLFQRQPVSLLVLPAAESGFNTPSSKMASIESVMMTPFI